MKLTQILTPQVRVFIYGAAAAILMVATSNGWVTDDLAKSVNDNLPTILGAVSAIIAAANVKVKQPVVEATPEPVVIAAPAPTPVMQAAQAGAVEMPLV